MPVNGVANLVTNKDKYDTENAWWGRNPMIQYGAITAPSLPQSCGEVSVALKHCRKAAPEV